MTDLTELLHRWDSGEGKPYKGSLIDWTAFEEDPASIGCMCAQGQVLHLLAGWSPKELRDTEQDKADLAVAKKLNISIAHSILLRRINDKADGAPSVVLTHPEKILGDQAHIVLAFWLHLDRMKKKDWDAAFAVARAVARDAAWVAARAVARDAARDAAWDDAARDAAWDVAGLAPARDAARDDAARDAAWGAARDAAWGAARDAAFAVARAVAWDASRDAAWAAGYACGEIQGARIMREKGQAFFFLPMFGFADPESIPALPVDYGVPQ